MRGGKASKTISTAISKLFMSSNNINKSQKGTNGCDLVALRLFSSFDGKTGGGYSKRNDFDGFSDRKSGNNDDRLSGYDRKSRGNDHFSSRDSGRPNNMRGGGGGGGGDRQTGHFQGRNDNYTSGGGGRGGGFGGGGRRGGRNDGFSRGGGRGGGRGRGRNVRFDGGGDDGFVSFDGDDDERKGGLGEGEERKGSRPSIRELLNAPLPEGEKGIDEEGEEFLEKFKLGGGSEVKKEELEEGVKSVPAAPEEEKMEAPENADEIFKKMKQSGLIPNAVAMLDGLCKDGLVQEAMKLFGLMREKGTMPEVVVYTAVVEGFCNAQKLDDAIRVFRKMQSNGIVPNAFSYTVLVKGLCKVLRLEDAVDVCVEMLEGGHAPNVMTFTGLIHEFCKERGVEEAREVIKTLQQKGFFLDEKAVRTYLDKTGPRSPLVWEAIFGPKKTTQTAF